MESFASSRSSRRKNKREDSDEDEDKDKGKDRVERTSDKRKAKKQKPKPKKEADAKKKQPIDLDDEGSEDDDGEEVEALASDGKKDRKGEKDEIEIGEGEDELGEAEDENAESEGPLTTILKASEVAPYFKSSKLVFGQLGGGKSSHAGDAGFLSAHESRRFATFDFGHGGAQTSNANLVRQKEDARDPDSQGSQWTTDEESESAEVEDQHEKAEDEDEDENGEGEDQDAPSASAVSGKKIALITHKHKDHVGGDPKNVDVSAFDRVFVGASQPKMKMGKKKSDSLVHEVEDQGERLFGWKEKRDGGLSTRGTAIVPHAPRSSKDDNQMSLGALISVDKRAENEGETDRRVLTMLTTGDMTARESSGPVKEAVEEDGYTPDIIKMPHHGSENNIGVIDPKLVGKKTTVLISGYTMTDTSKLGAFLGKTGPGEVFILFESKELADEFMSIAACSKLVEERGVQLVKDYYVFVGPKGEVQRIATKW